jgi:hypothetical protein
MTDESADTLRQLRGHPETGSAGSPNVHVGEEDASLLATAYLLHAMHPKVARQPVRRVAKSDCLLEAIEKFSVAVQESEVAGN